MPVLLEDYPGSGKDRETKFIRAIDSFLNQECDFPVQLVIVGDGCEKAHKIIKDKYPHHYNIVFLNSRREQVRYSGALRNKGISIAEHDLICYLDSDDYIGTTHLISIVESFNKNSGLDWVYWDDMQVTRHDSEMFATTINLTELKQAKIGTSCFAHKKDCNVKWETGYYHDWLFIQSLIAQYKEVQKIEGPEYYVCHRGELDF